MPSTPHSGPLRVAAIRFLNPAPLLWNFEHEPAATDLRQRYNVQYTLPALCAEQMRTGEADLGLIPIAALPTLPDVVAVPGCVIASQGRVRSIQLVLKPGVTTATVKTLATDSASRSSTAYVRTMLRSFFGNEPEFTEAPADLAEMLQDNDGALLIGDAALLALEQRNVSGAFLDHTWCDVAALWNQHTGLPWVAAVWAVRAPALARSLVSRDGLIADLNSSRDAGLSNIDAIVHDWEGRIALPAATIREYLTHNIYYRLDDPCLAAIEHFYSLASDVGVLPPYKLRLL